MEKIVITGASGFIGSALAKYLSKDYKIIGIDRNKPNYKLDKFIVQDLNDDLPNFRNIFAVLHLAGKGGVRESQDKFHEYVHDNINATKKVLDMCIKWKPTKFIFSSSSSVYGECYGESDEDDQYNPMSLYAATKVMCEQEIKSYKNNGLLNADACIMRLFTLYGPNQRKGLAMRNFIDNVLQDKEITINGDGTQVRDFTYIGNLCQGIENLLKSNYMPMVTNMGYGNSDINKLYSVNEVVEMISELTGKTPLTKRAPMNRFDVMKTCSGTKKSLDYLPWTEYVPMREGLKNQIEWAKNELRLSDSV